MPYFQRGGARLHYVEQGQGPAIITTHGVAENHLYWSLPGIVDRLAEAGYRVISADMRGHGRSRVEGPEKGYDVGTLADDIGALADHLALERFHLLTHATGGMAGLRYAMDHHRRLLSLMSTHSGSATWPTDEAAEVTDPDARIQPSVQAGPHPLAAAFRGRPWVQILQGARERARQDVFLGHLHLAEDPRLAFDWYERCARLGDPDTLADFMDSFYDDPDPRIARLRTIACPCLVLVGEYDHMFVKPSAQLAREIPSARHVVMKGRGHMTAFEDPQALAGELLTFLRGLPRAG
jgi:3-oxoadipate enol-lactonase